ncbi:cytochrome P450 [Mycobacterium sp. pR1184]|uniref:cytochrome P450 n=1 Tax=Mycobacterium sp. pR1184 TaxID=3238981 RepID=UPI00351AD10B
MRTSIWIRWMARYGAPRAFLAVQARRGQPLARFLLGRARGAEMYRLVEDIRQQGRMVRRPFVWVSADHEICRTVLRDDRFGVTNIVNAPLPQPFPALLDRTDPGLPNPVERPAMVMSNPPDHTRYRRLFAQSFTPRAIDRLGARVEEITAELLDGLERNPQPDLVADFATELPVAVITEILGLPVDARPQVREWGYSLAPLLDFGTSWKTFRQAVERLQEVDSYAAAFIERARAGDARDDPFGRVAAGGELTHREFAANAALLVGAGFETTVNLIGNGIVLLLQHPHQLALLRDDPGLWPAAVEEILRFESPVQMLVRSARRDAEIAGQHIRAGSMFVLLMGGANRDPRVFSDPGRFDITRPNARDHVAFGSGIHGCLGAALARIEGVIALRTLFERFPTLSLREQPEPLELVTLHGFKRLPVELRTRPAGEVSQAQ